MDVTTTGSPPTVRWIRWLARALLVAWAAFWLWFNVAVLVAEWGDHGIGALINHGTLALVILIAGGVAWLWPLVGGIVLLGLTAFGLWFFGAGLNAALLLTLPPAFIGWLLIAAWFASRRPASS
jgi:hypothetical protein